MNRSVRPRVEHSRRNRSRTLIAGVALILALPIADASAKPKGQCLIGVDITSSVVGRSSPSAKWGEGVRDVLKNCQLEKMNTTLTVISSAGEGSYSTLGLPFNSTKNEDDGIRLRGKARKWLEGLSADPAGSTDILSTLSTMSTNLRGEPQDPIYKVYLFTDGIQTAEYSFLKNVTPDQKYFAALIGKVASEGAVYRFPKNTIVSFVGFFDQAELNRNVRLSGKLQNLVSGFWETYFVKAGVAKGNVKFESNLKRTVA